MDTIQTIKRLSKFWSADQYRPATSGFFRDGEFVIATDGTRMAILGVPPEMAALPDHRIVKGPVVASGKRLAFDQTGASVDGVTVPYLDANAVDWKRVVPDQELGDLTITFPAGSVAARIKAAKAALVDWTDAERVEAAILGKKLEKVGITSKGPDLQVVIGVSDPDGAPVWDLRYMAKQVVRDADGATVKEALHAPCWKPIVAFNALHIGDACERADLTLFFDSSLTTPKLASNATECHILMPVRY